MSTTIKTHLQNLAEDLGITVPDSFVGNTDDTARRLLRAANAAGAALAKRPWRALVFEHTFTTADGTLEYALPTSPNFKKILPKTSHDRTNFRGLIGPANAAKWQYGEAVLTDGTGLAHTFRIKRSTDTPRVDKIYLLDNPAGAYTLAFEYVTDEWLYDGSSGYRTGIVADADQPLFDLIVFQAETKWRLLRALGEPFFDEKDEARRLADVELAGENGEVLNLVPRQRNERMLYPNVPETGYGL